MATLKKKEVKEYKLTLSHEEMVAVKRALYVGITHQAPLGVGLAAYERDRTIMSTLANLCNREGVYIETQG